MLLAAVPVILQEMYSDDETENDKKKPRYKKKIAGTCKGSPFAQFLSLGDDPTYPVSGFIKKKKKKIFRLKV